MAKRKKSLVVLFITLLIVSLTTMIVKNIKVEKEKIANIEDTIIDCKREDISEISWTYENQNLAFIKKDDIWYLSSDEAFPVDQDKINEILDEVRKIDVSFIIEDVSDYSQYGLKSPQVTLNFTTSEEEYTLKFGNYSSMDEERYVDIEDGNVYLLTNDIMDDFDLEVSDFFAYEDLPDVSDFKEMIISGENNLDIIYDDDNEYTYSKLFTYFLKNKNYKALDNSLVKTMANNITNLELNDYASYTANNEDLSAYGLAEPRIKVEFIYLDDEQNEQSFVVYLSSDEIPEDEDDNVNYYLRIEDSNIIYPVNHSLFETFTEASYDSLRPTEVLLLDFTQVNKYEIELDDEEYVVVSQTDNKETTYKLNDEEVEFAQVIEQLEDMSIVEYSNDIPDKVMQLSLKLYLSDETTLTLKFYKYDAENCILVFNNEYKALVDRDDVLDLIEDINGIVLA